MIQTVERSQQSLGLPKDLAGSANLTEIKKVLTVESMAQHAERLRMAYGPGSRIQIEVFPLGYGRQINVYVPGTQSFSFGGNNPLNIRSGLTALGGSVAPSEQAVQDALTQLGAGQGDRVLFIGHSQGALVAGNIVTAPQPYEIKGLISFGGPISHLDIKVPTIAIAHQSDPVPVLGGGVNPMRENWVSVSGHSKFETLVDAHRLNGYEKTAAELDESSDPGFRRIQNKLWQDPGVSGLKYSFEIRRG
jgi:pimeloyl-ACP methyl ester carboxylesterase